MLQVLEVQLPDKTMDQTLSDRSLSVWSIVWITGHLCPSMCHHHPPIPLPLQLSIPCHIFIQGQAKANYSPHNDKFKRSN
jgi:hypothetical protein